MFSYYGIDERMNWESICWSVVSGLLDKLDSPLFEKYSLGDYLKQVRSSLFREWELNEPVSEERKTLQRRYIWRLKQLAQNGKSLIVELQYGQKWNCRKFWHWLSNIGIR